MSKLIHNSHTDQVYAVLSDRPLHQEEQILKCPECGNDELEDFREVRMYPPFVCSVAPNDAAKPGCGMMFTAAEAIAK